MLANEEWRLLWVNGSYNGGFIDEVQSKQQVVGPASEADEPGKRLTYQEWSAAEEVTILLFIPGSVVSEGDRQEPASYQWMCWPHVNVDHSMYVSLSMFMAYRSMA